MSRRRSKNRKKTEFVRKHEFRYNDSKQAKHHPHYVFGQIGDDYVSFGITRHPKKQYKVTPLTRSPNPQNRDKNYIRHKVFKTDKSLYGDKKGSWSFHPDDKEMVRDMVRGYKKHYRKDMQAKKKRK